jgi:hypothetical protein
MSSGEDIVVGNAHATLTCNPLTDVFKPPVERVEPIEDGRRPQIEKCRYSSVHRRDDDRSTTPGVSRQRRCRQVACIGFKLVETYGDGRSPRS